MTGGIGERELADEYKANGDDYNAIMIQAVADRLAEAFCWIPTPRGEDIWGYAPDEDLSNDDLIRERNTKVFVLLLVILLAPEHTEGRCGSWWMLKTIDM